LGRFDVARYKNPTALETTNEVKTLKIQDPFKEGAFYRIILKVTFLVKAKANKAVLQTSRSPGFFPNNMNRFKL